MRQCVKMAPASLAAKWTAMQTFLCRRLPLVRPPRFAQHPTLKAEPIGLAHRYRTPKAYNTREGEYPIPI